MTQKAVVAKVNIGSISIEGLMLPDGTFGMTLQQFRELAFPSTSPNNAKRTLEAACGKDFQLLRVVTELSNNPQWVVPLGKINFCLTELAFKGHEDARNLVRLLSELSLNQLFCDAFDIKFEKEERQSWIKWRESHRQQYHVQFTIWGKHDGLIDNQYGTRLNAFKAKLGLPLVNIEQYSAEQLDKLNQAEAIYHTLRSIPMSHDTAMLHIH